MGSWQAAADLAAGGHGCHGEVWPASGALAELVMESSSFVCLGGSVLFFLSDLIYGIYVLFLVYCLASLPFWWLLKLFGFGGLLASCASCVLSFLRALLRTS